MSRWPFLLAFATLGLSLAPCEPLLAQGYQYNTPPALSPWLNLNQRQGGAVDNYHLFVQPQMQLQNTLQSQQLGIQRNANALDTATSEVQAANAPPIQTGVGAGFMTQAYYFNTMRPGAMGASGAGTSMTGRGAYGPLSNSAFGGNGYNGLSNTNGFGSGLNGGGLGVGGSGGAGLGGGGLGVGSGLVR